MCLRCELQRAPAAVTRVIEDSDSRSYADTNDCLSKMIKITIYIYHNLAPFDVAEKIILEIYCVVEELVK